MNWWHYPVMLCHGNVVVGFGEITSNNVLWCIQQASCHWEMKAVKRINLCFKKFAGRDVERRSCVREIYAQSGKLRYVFSSERLCSISLNQRIRHYTVYIYLHTNWHLGRNQPKLNTYSYTLYSIQANENFGFPHIIWMWFEISPYGSHTKFDWFFFYLCQYSFFFYS